MSCGFLKCMFVGKSAIKKSLSALDVQLDKCTECCFNKSSSKHKEKTYKNVRLEYVRKYRPFSL